MNMWGSQIKEDLGQYNQGNAKAMGLLSAGNPQAAGQAAWQNNIGLLGAVSPVKIPIYRGEGVTNAGGKYWTQDREFARQFTQSGRDHEIKSANIDEAHIYQPPSPVYAGDPDAIDAVVAEARKAGFKAVRLDEGVDQPPSIFVFNKTALK